MGGNEGTKIKQYFGAHHAQNETRFSLAECTIKPGKRSLRHKLRSSETYYILEGLGILRVNDESCNVKKDDSVIVPPMSEQSIENNGKENLRFLCIVDPAWKKEDEIVLE